MFSSLMDEMEYIAALDSLPELCASYLARNFVCSQLILNFCAQSLCFEKLCAMHTHPFYFPHTPVNVCPLIFFDSYDLTFKN